MLEVTLLGERTHSITFEHALLVVERAVENESTEQLLNNHRNSCYRVKWLHILT